MFSVRFLVVASLSCAWGRALAGECEPRGSPVTSFEIEVERAARVSRELRLPAGARVLIEVFEYGNNLRVELAQGGVVRRSDNALRRWAPQRLLVNAGRDGKATISVIGQERTRGRATVHVYRIVPADDRKCLAFWAHSAAADEHFSKAELISNGKLDAPPGAAAQAYGMAAGEYRLAVDAIRPVGGLLLPQAQLTLSAAQIIGLGAWQDAAANASAAEHGFEAAGSDYGVDRARFYWARTQIHLAKRAADRSSQERQLERAHDVFTAVSENHRKRGETYDSAFALTWAAFTRYMADRFPENIAESQQALDAFEPLDEPLRKVQLRQNIANAQFEIGRFQEALANYAAALQAADPETELDMYRLIVSNIAYTEFRLGKPDAALRHYSEALQLARRIQNDEDEARSLHGLGVTYHSIGNLSEATSYLERALDMRNRLGDEADRSATLMALADVLRDGGRLREALARHQEALGASRQGPLRLARIRVEIARDHFDLGELPAAKDVLRTVLDDEKLEDPVVRARATLIGARIALVEGRLTAAARDADAVTGYFRSQQLTRNEFEGLLLQARIACARRDRRGALRTADVAMRLAEEIRISSNNPTLRAALWGPLRPAFDFEVGVLAGIVECGDAAPDPAGALAIAEVSRNRALSDLRRQVENAAPGGADGARRELFERLAQRRSQIETLSGTVATSDARLKILREEAAALMREIDLAGGSNAPPSTADGFANRAPSLDARGLPADTAVLEYWLGESRTLAWLITRERQQMFDLGPTSAIESTARSLLESMHDWTRVPAAERLRRSRELHRLVVEPMKGELARARTIFFVPDGTLHAVPFAALADGSASAPRFLVDSHDVATAPTLRAVTASRPFRIDAARALIVADPVYSRQDARFSTHGVSRLSEQSPREAVGTLRGAQSWARLPASGREAADIARLLSGRTNVEMLSGFDASRTNILARDLGVYQIVHFATHAVADSEAPQLSAVVLSTVAADGQARVGELFAGELAMQRVAAGLVVLSGCDTALGRAAAGEGLLGMRYAAHASGARYVVASLWPVMDAAGSRLMRDMYRGIIDQKLTPVAALSRAMRTARRQWADPALWGAYDVSSGADR